MFVCHCRVVSDRAIRAAIAGGACDVEAVAAACGAGGACGACVPGIEQLLEEAGLAVRAPALVGARQTARRQRLSSRPVSSQPAFEPTSAA